MTKTPLIITGLLGAVALVASGYVGSGAFGLSGSEIVNAEIAIFACLGGAVSATFVIYGYLRANESFVESQRPQLLLQVRNLHAQDPSNPNQTIPMTQLWYKNITANRFVDLSLDIAVTAQKRTESLSDLFRAKMTMVGYDERQRTFNTTQELGNRNINLAVAATQGYEVTLTTKYSYTFGGKRDEVEVNIYRWDPASSEWQIA